MTRARKTPAQRAVDSVTRKMRRTARQRERESLTAAEIEDKMVRTIAEAMRDRGAVVKADFLRAGVPASAIDPNFKRCLAIARERDPNLGAVEIAA
jgi:hypothetical protein